MLGEGQNAGDNDAGASPADAAQAQTPTPSAANSTYQPAKPDTPKAFKSDLAESEFYDAQDRHSAKTTLLVELEEAFGDDGNGEFESLRRLINGYLDRLPAEKRAQVERGVTDRGVRYLNDVDSLKYLAAEATKAPEELITAAKKNGISAKAQLESWMRDRNSLYWNGKDDLPERLQFVYRQIIRGEKS